MKKKPEKKKPSKKKKPETRGRKTKLNDELHKTFVNMAEVYDIEDIRDAFGIPKGTYDSWIQQGKEGKKPFAQFYYDMKAAKAKRRMRNVKTIQKTADSGDWKAAAWLQARLNREKYGDHIKTEQKHEVSIETFADICRIVSEHKEQNGEDS